jgi:hypothetical protein
MNQNRVPSEVRKLRIFFNTSVDVACMEDKDGQVDVDSTKLEAALCHAVSSAALEFFRKDLINNVISATVTFDFDEEIGE